MRLVLNLADKNIKRTIDRITIFHWAHLLFFVIATLLEKSKGLIGIWFWFKILLIILIYKSFFKTLKNYYYTFWAFSAVLIAYFSYKVLAMGFSLGTISIAYFYFVAIVTLGFECYYLFNPIYFPRLNWWEYDFRYINDIKVNTRIGVDIAEARLSDVRKGAGCLTSFNNYELGAELDLIYDGNPIPVKIMSKKENLFGRGIQYGVIFLINTEADQLRYNGIYARWKKSVSIT